MPQSHEQDLIIVRNIDIDCDFVDDEGNDHSQAFSVKWGGIPHSIRPGATKLMPRFLADHYAKHLTDHILTKEQNITKKIGLVNDAKRRKAVIESILVGVEQFYMGDVDIEAGEAVARQVEQLNKEDEELMKRPLDLGKVPHKALGYSRGADDLTVVIPPKEEMEENPIPKPVKAKAADTATPTKRTHKELLEECEKLEIELTGKETTKELEAKLAAF